MGAYEQAKRLKAWLEESRGKIPKLEEEIFRLSKDQKKLDKSHQS